MSFFSNLRDTLGGGSDRLSSKEFLQRRSGDDAVVIDVRTPNEYAQGHLADARNLDVMTPQFREEAGKLDADKTYYLYCRSGNRSGQAARIMREMGYDAYNVGGLNELVRAGADVSR